MSGYIGNIPVPQATQTRDNFTATSGQTTFSTSGYTPSYLDVYLNGVHLDPSDYTATNGTDVVLGTGATAGDVLEVVAFSTFETVDQDFSGDFSVDGSTFVVDSTNNNVGIGTTSPDNLLHVSGSGDVAKITTDNLGGLLLNRDTDVGSNSTHFQLQFTNSDSTVALIKTTNRTGATTSTGTGYELKTEAFGTGYLTYHTNGSERMRIDSSGNVGIGTTTPVSKLDFIGSSGAPTYKGTIRVKGGSSLSDDCGVEFVSATSGGGYGWRIAAPDLLSSNTPLTFESRTSSATWSEKLRIATDGKISINYSSAVGPANLQIRQSQAGAYACIGAFNTGGAGSNLLLFANALNNAIIGSISNNGNTSTSYNTTSDYRLKTDVQPMTGATERLKALKPVNFEWISSGERVDGFLAHEAQEVVPEAVTGTKDAMRTEEYEVTPAVLDDDGNVVTEAVMGTREVPDYQGIDQSKLVPLLVAAMQEQQTVIEDLKARIEVLEGA